MSKIGALAFDLQEQDDAEFFGKPVEQAAKPPLVSEFEALKMNYAAYRRQRTRKAAPAIPELNFFN